MLKTHMREKHSPLQKAFSDLATAPSAQMRAMKDLEDFDRSCKALPCAGIVLYCGGPLTAMAATFAQDKSLAARVMYLCAMSG